MKDKSEALDEAYKKAGHNTYFNNGFYAGVKYAQAYIDISDEFPSLENGYVDELVLVFVKNKNKEDGIILWDLSSFDGSSWSKRNNTWEDIIGWRPVFIE